MTVPYKATGRRAPHLKRVQCDIDEAAYALLTQACARSPRGRLLGLARVLNRCIYLVLGPKSGMSERQDS